MKHAISLLIVMLWCHDAPPIAFSAEIPVSVKRIFAAHCLHCHDDSTKEGGFSLVSLEPDFRQPAWVRVHDKIARGQMPPAGEGRPEPAEIKQVTEWLSQELTRTTLAGRAQDGRTSLRRMNRREYETTLHDLLGIALPLRDMLPEDNLIHGFDTLARGLDTSSSHLLSYQRAADRALAEALPTFPAASDTKRHTGKAYLESRLPVHRTTGIDPFVRVDGDTLIYHATVGGDMGMQAPHPPMPGRYRIRAAVRPVNNGARPMTVFVGKRVDRFQAEKHLHIVDYFDIPAGRTTVIDVETDLKYSQGNQFIYFEALGLPGKDEVAKQRGADGGKPLPADFAGPGLAMGVLDTAAITRLKPWQRFLPRQGRCRASLISNTDEQFTIGPPSKFASRSPGAHGMRSI